MTMKRLYLLLTLSLTAGSLSAEGTHTYWTADGTVRPLPQDGLTLTVPAEAAAVDLRGNRLVGDIYTMDVTAANPNCLYYLDGEDYLPQGLDDTRLVVRNYKLSDFWVDEHYDYYCPMPFDVQTALFTYTPESGATEDALRSGTLVLPFDVQRVWLSEVNGSPGIDVALNGPELKICRYQDNLADVLEFEPVGEHRLNAYEPYLISRVLPSPVTFYAENITIPATREAVAHGYQFDFVGTTVGQRTSEGVFCWSGDHNCFYLRDADKTVRPFTAFMSYIYDGFEDEASLETLGFGKLYVVESPIDSESATGMDSVSHISNATNQQAVYTLGGQRLGTTGVNSLKPGLYIVGGRKIVVK